MGGERTEKPTPRRLREARREGRVARTPDLGAWGGMLAASMLLPMVVRHLLEAATRLLTRLRAVVLEPDPGRVSALLGDGAREAVLAAAPLAIGLLLLGVVASAAQGGLHPATALLVPKLSRLNPVDGLKRTFGPHAWWETAKALAKTAVLALVLSVTVRRLVPVLMASGTLPWDVQLKAVVSAALTLIRSAAVAGLVMAAADYAVARRRIGRQLRMSRAEVQEEQRRSEGNPHLKSAIRARQLAARRSRMMTDLVKADVVLVNPTHVAVALRYEPGRGAPRVVARGAGAVAARIRAVATEHRIPMVSDPPLARLLYSSCDLGEEIPPELFTAVARVLAFVMALRARGSAAGLHRPPVPGVR
ncbi:MAG: EscU/YscU/HrcU family type III secretion system export apparatus switch protein [Actinobacteria bacterium]|nr:EscU/YscU/HrcU family type III secretion system export apparatus switch protein [Actinomycetota bacterium]